MVPSSDNDDAPKAPDKGDKQAKGDLTAAAGKSARHQQQHPEPDVAISDNKEAASVSRLDDIELKALLDEAINYKLPKDRVGKSKLFQNLLEKAEEDDRKARATSASGSESVRYYNSRASHHRGARRKHASSSVSERSTHGGSLNNLTKEELFAAPCQLSSRPFKTVSARQRQGGSLPCNVNTALYDKRFFEAAAVLASHQAEQQARCLDVTTPFFSHGSDFVFATIDIDSENAPPEPHDATVASAFVVSRAGDDDSPSVASLDRSSDRGGSTNSSEVIYDAPLPLPPQSVAASNSTMHTQGASTPCGTLLQSPSILSAGRKVVDDKKVDENGNAVGPTESKKNKKKKCQTDKNVVLLKGNQVSHNMEGHKGDIINDINKLVEFIEGDKDQQSKSRSGAKAGGKAKLQHKNSLGNEDKGSKKRVHTKSKSEKLKKSNSMEEVSVSKLHDFGQEKDDIISNKSAATLSRSVEEGGSKDGHSHGISENLVLHGSTENLNSGFQLFLTKRSKKQHQQLLQHSVANEEQRPTSVRESESRKNNFESSFTKYKSLQQQNEKSSDSSDADSVKSITNINDSDQAQSPSYAEIAKNNTNVGPGTVKERSRWNMMPSERKSSQEQTSFVASSVEERVVVVSGDISIIGKVFSSSPTVTSTSVTCTVHVEESSHVDRSSKTEKTSDTADSLMDGRSTVIETLAPQISDTASAAKNTDVKVELTSSSIGNSNKVQETIQSTTQLFNVKSEVLLKADSCSKSNPQDNICFKDGQKRIRHEIILPTRDRNVSGIYWPNVRAMSSVHMSDSTTSSTQLIQNMPRGGGILPSNTPDVQTIEKLLREQQQNQAQVEQQRQHRQQYQHYKPQQQPPMIEASNASSYGTRRKNQNLPLQQQRTTLNGCDNERSSSSSSSSSRSPAVILRRNAANSEPTFGLTFGFDINEQLLWADKLADNFSRRFHAPTAFTINNTEDIVGYMSSDWNNIVRSANAQYYDQSSSS